MFLSEQYLQELFSNIRSVVTNPGVARDSLDYKSLEIQIANMERNIIARYTPMFDKCKSINDGPTQKKCKDEAVKKVNKAISRLDKLKKRKTNFEARYRQ